MMTRLFITESISIIIIFNLKCLPCMEDGNTLYLPPCHHVIFDNCLKKDFFTFGRREDVNEFATSSRGFDQICRSFNASLQCINKHLQECSNTYHQETFALLIRPMVRNFQKYMCNLKNKNRTEFLSNATCIRRNVFAVDEAIPCLNNYLLAFEFVEMKSRDGAGVFRISNWFETICCAHARKRECTNQLAKSNCGTRIAELFDEFFEQIHFGFFKLVCSPFVNLSSRSEYCYKAFPIEQEATPLAFKSKSAVSRFLVSYFPFNYVTNKVLTLVQQLYKNNVRYLADNNITASEMFFQTN